jgi:phosphoribosylglycinamide formyltransferase-1
MVKAKIAVLVSGGGTNLQALIDAQKSGIIKSGEIVLVISNNETAYALERAKNNDIATKYIPSKAPDFETQLINTLKNNEIDIIVLAGFMKILSGDFTKTFENRIINVHPSLIPSFCGKGFYGLKVHEEALKYGVKVTGATVHFVNEIPDGGDIIMQKAVYIEKGDTPEILQKRVMEQAEWIILPEACEIVSQKYIKE